MNWISFVLAIYGAALSSALGYLTWRKDRHSLRFFTSYHHRSDWYGVQISVVNVGFRPITLNDVCFEQRRGGGYLNELDETLGLPHRLEEGQQLVFAFHAEDIEPDTTAFVVRDTHRREHRLRFTPEMRGQLVGLGEFVEEMSPELHREAQQRFAPTARRDRGSDS